VENCYCGAFAVKCGVGATCAVASDQCVRCDLRLVGVGARAANAVASYPRACSRKWRPRGQLLCGGGSEVGADAVEQSPAEQPSG